MTANVETTALKKPETAEDQERVVLHLNLHVSCCTLITSIFCGYDEAASVMLSVGHPVRQAQTAQRHLPKCVDEPEIKHPR